MTIKKIKNIKFSESKNQEEAKWVELLARRNRLLLETDWTQMPDVRLTSRCRNEWVFWRQSLRLLKRINFESSSEFKRALDDVESYKNFIPIEYANSDSINSLESGKLFLHKLLVSFYEEKMNYKFTPNLDEKYQEALDVISRYFVENDIEFNSFNIQELIEFLKNKDNPEINIDIKEYDFLEVVQSVKNYQMREILIFILEQKQEYYDLALREEYNLLHYEHRIDACVSVEDVLLAKREIEMFYGH